MIASRSNLATTALKGFLVLALQYCVNLDETQAAGASSTPNAQTIKMAPPPSPAAPPPKLQSATSPAQNSSADDERETQQHAKDTIRVMLNELNSMKP